MIYFVHEVQEEIYLLKSIYRTIVFMPQIQNGIIEILSSFAVVDSGSIPTKEDGTRQ